MGGGEMSITDKAISLNKGVTAVHSGVTSRVKAEFKQQDNRNQYSIVLREPEEAWKPMSE